ncbi:hypothetical protein [Nitratiruptor sp. SB155-2]|uniref:hypothetical protein n=1 Tax=Nitratiruptor sp. (strain SB155-2) TaxID=387092 RepID=UPI0002DDA4C3|nr:hypothetical protein [Nitratiruptor sp. SB155-2]
MQAALIEQGKLYTFDGKFEALKLKAYKNLRIGAFINSKQLITFTTKLPLSLQQEQLDIQVELKMYQEGGLDPNKSYVIDYLAFPIQQENVYLIEAYALPQEVIEEQFGQIAKKIGFIDILFPRFLIYKSLYAQGSNPAKNHLFLHIGEEEAYAALYKDGEYIAYRSIESLAELASQCGIEVAKLKALLSEKGLRQENYTLHEMNIFDVLQERFYKNAEKIVYAINYKRSYFGIEQIDTIFLDFDGGGIEGLEAIMLAAGMTGEVVLQPLKYRDLSPKESAIALAIEYIANYEKIDQKLNFTIFERKKPIYRYRSFQFLVFAATVIIFFGVGTLFLYRQVHHFDELIAQKEHEISQLRKKNKRLMEKLKRLRDQKKQVLKQKKEILHENELAELTLSAIPMIEEGKKKRQEMMNDIIEALYRYKLTTKSIDQNGTSSINVDLVSRYERREKIGAFIRYLLEKGYSDISTKEIVRDKAFYESLVKVRK